MYFNAIIYRRAMLPVFLIAGLLLSTGCKKSGGYPISAGATFRFAGYAQLKPTRAFIHTGEILDTTVVAALSDNNEFLSDAAIEADIPAYDSIYFATPDSGVVFGYGQSYSFHLRRSGNNLTFIASNAIPQDLDTTFVTAVDSAEVFYPYLLTGRKYDSGPFYLYELTYQAFATQTSANQLNLPGMIRTIIKPSVSYISGIFNNKFNPAFDCQLLPPGDTLVFRECTMLMRKQ